MERDSAGSSRLFLKRKIESTALSIRTIGSLYCVNGRHLNDLYRNKPSGFHDWRRTLFREGYYVSVDSIGPHMSLDETGLSGDRVYTVLTNKDGHGGHGTLAAIIPGTKSDFIRLYNELYG